VPNYDHTLTTFWTHDELQAIVPQLAELVQIRHNISGNTKLVLEETAGSYGGGAFEE
jgi:hypothetical protein